MHEIDNVIATAKRVMEARKRGILVTVVGTRGSTYRRAGARAVISEDGQSFGTISGGCVESDLAERARAWLDDFHPRVFTYDASRTDDIIFGLGLGCRGETEMLIEPFDRNHPPRLVRDFRWNGRQPVVWKTEIDGRELLVETIRPQYAIAIFGGGRDVAPVARLAEQIGWRASVIAPKDVHPEEVCEKVDLHAFDAAVVMTHNFMHDLALLEILLPSAIPYVGLLGPKSRGDDLLARANLSRGRLRNPIGLDLGADTPEEIALSIVAEVQALLAAHDARPLSGTDGPIHGRAEARPTSSRQNP